ncbi:uncharacterized protein [Parasteatoda tepidariorum]|uniref:uncharacterized protein n=1 Tax=Parasteatoda tepidariorum TaxID=114398 RepID=UPI00077F93B2|nr:uncharacterized protein LOC107442869 [Parasteatoda tepidariorum]
MSERRKTKIFLRILFAFILHKSVESHPSDVRSIDGLDVGPPYNIVRNPDEGVSVKEENQTISVNSLGKLKDSSLEAETGNKLINLLETTNFFTTAEPHQETDQELKLYIEEGVNEKEEKEGKIDDGSSLESIYGTDEEFNEEINTVIIHGNGSSFTIRPHKMIVIKDSAELDEEDEEDDEEKASVILGSLKNDSYIHRISRRKVSPNVYGYGYHSDSVSEDDALVYNARAPAPESECETETECEVESEERLTAPKGSCKVPKNFAHSEVFCIVYGSYTNCTQTCTRGYKLKGKPYHKRIQVCYKSRGVWGPSKSFSDCVPEVDCNIKISSGRAHCTYNSITHHPTCKVHCKATNIKELKSAKKYKCKKHPKKDKAQWSPKLPKCAKPSKKKHYHDQGHRFLSDHHHYQPKRGKALVLEELEKGMESNSSE